MFDKSVTAKQEKKAKNSNLGDYDKINAVKRKIEVKDLKQVLKSVLPKLKHEKISRSESCI